VTVRWGVVGLWVLSGCYVGVDAGDGIDSLGSDSGGMEDGEGSSGGDEVDDPLASGPTGLRLLTPTQYRNSVADVLGEVEVETIGQWRSSIAAAQGGVSAALVEDYEESALAVSSLVFGDPALRMEVAGCSPTMDPDDACVAEVIERLGRQAWRRPLEADELERYAGVATSTAELLGNDPWQGLAHAVAGLLQSPNFLYRVEVGEPIGEDSDRTRLDGYELASRLSYLAWNTTPDEALLDAVANGSFEDSEGIADEVQRLLDSPRAREGAVQVFVDMLDLDALLSLQKDPLLLPAFTPTIGPSMREELVHTIEDTVVDGRDLRRLFDTPNGFVNAELAALYGLSGEFDESFTEVALPEGRGGLLTLGGFLAINSGEASTSPTKRGLLVRTVLMCQSIPPPPPDVEAELPEPEGDTPKTKREQLSEHAENPACAACHDFMDPIGFGLETFDALGGYRLTDNGLPIDPSGELDGEPFADAVELGARLSENPALANCMVRNLYRYAVGHVEQPDEATILEGMNAALTDNDYDLRAAIEALVTHEAFGVGLWSEEEAP